MQIKFLENCFHWFFLTSTFGLKRWFLNFSSYIRDILLNLCQKKCLRQIELIVGVIFSSLLTSLKIGFCSVKCSSFTRPSKWHPHFKQGTNSHSMHFSTASLWEFSAGYYESFLTRSTILPYHWLPLNNKEDYLFCLYS